MIDLEEPKPKLRTDSALLAVVAACLSTAVLSLGVLRCLSITLSESGKQLGTFVVEDGVLWVSIIGAVVGRLLSIWIQAEAAGAAAGSAGRLRANRLHIIQGVLRSQFPVAAGDLIVGVTGLLGLVSFKTLVALAMSPLNPFLAWSVFVFVTALGEGIPGAQFARARRRTILAFVGFLYFARLMIFMTSLTPKA